MRSTTASGYQLATGDPVMAVGGANCTDPAPTLAQFERYVADGRIHYFLATGGSGGNDNASKITTWVEQHFVEKTVGGIQVYDLTARR